MLASPVGSPVFLGGFVLRAAAMLLVNGAIPPLLYEILLADGRADEYPRHAGRFNAALEASGVVTALVAGLLASGPGLGSTFPLAATCLAGAVIASRLLHEPASHHGETADHGMRRLGREALASVRVDHRIRSLVLLSATTSSSSCSSSTSWSSPTRSRWMSPGEVGLVTAMTRDIALAASLLAFLAIRRWGPSRVILSAIAATIVGQAAVVPLPILLALPAIGLAAAGRGLLAPALAAELDALISSDRRATIHAAANMGSSLLLAVSQPAALGLFTAIGPQAAVLAGIASSRPFQA